ncbi:DUF1971 domain-containing protein [Candidatus Gracilibacteria bacterium]|nr:DUF1971 domain-containing protein [Candidatus Gracilibacteria bacterium]
MIPKTYYKYKEMPIWENDTIAPGLLKIHNTKIGVYGKINVMLGELEYTVYDGEDGNEVSTTILTPSNPGIAKPQEWHKIKPLGKMKMFVEFYKEKPESIQSKEKQIDEKYEKSPHMEISRLVEYMSNAKSKTALDIGCGGGRNSILLAENGFTVDAIDRNENALENITNLARENKLDITTQEVDLNSYKITKKYDCVISTVVLQFLDTGRAREIIEQMQSATNIGGYNVLIVPIDADDQLCPIRFPSLLRNKQVKEMYADWNILEYNEMLGRFHRKDEFGNKIISRFATIICQKV